MEYRPLASVTDHRVRAFELRSKDLLKHIFCGLIKQGMINDYMEMTASGAPEPILPEAFT